MPLKDKEARKKYNNEWMRKKRQGIKGNEVRKYQREYMEKWRQKNPGKIKNKTYQERLEYYRKYNQKNKEKLSKRKKEYYGEHRDYFIKKGAEWYKNNREKVAQKARELRKEVIEHYGNKCVCCGESQIEFLALDHKNNDGSVHRKETGVKMYMWAKRNNYPDRLQVLCYNCNMAKAFYGRCPHNDRIKS